MNTSFNKPTRCVLAFTLTILILSSCEDNSFNVSNSSTDPMNANNLASADYLNFLEDYLLYATFESDAIPGAPNKTLPGLPSGDKIKYDDNAGIFVLYSASQKSIYLPEWEWDIQPHEFISKFGSPGYTLTVTWSGQLVGHRILPNTGNSQGFKDMAISDNAGHVMANFTISGGNFHVNHSNGPDQFFNDMFPLQPTISQHTFTVTLRPHDRLFNLKILRHDGTIFTLNDIPFYGPYTQLANPKFKVSFTCDEGGYIIDNVTIRESPYIGPIDL